MKLEDLALHGIHSYIHTYVLTYIVNTGNLPNQGRKNILLQLIYVPFICVHYC